jgi:hypothetical protein
MEVFGSAALEAQVERAVRALEALGSPEGLAKAVALWRSLEAYRREATQAGAALQGAAQARREVRLALASGAPREELAAQREALRQAVASRDAAPYQHEGARLRLRAALMEAEGFVQASAAPGSLALSELVKVRGAPRQLH